MARGKITPHLNRQIVAALRQVSSEVRWKPGSAVRHLEKRKVRRHLPLEATLIDYNNRIHDVLTAKDAVVYLYWYKDSAYPTVVAVVDGDYWLVMVSLSGIIESAYVVENPDLYLSAPDFERLGWLTEVLV